MPDFDWQGYEKHLRTGGAPFGGRFDANIRQAVEAYQSVVADLREALVRVVDLYRHPDSGRLILEAGASEADDALLAAVAALGEKR